MQKLNVVRINPTRDEVGDPLQRVLADIRGRVWQKYAGRLEDVAVDANLHVKTVEGFAWGDTRKPHFETILKLLIALGMADYFMRLLATNNSITAEEARLRKGAR